MNEYESESFPIGYGKLPAASVCGFFFKKNLCFSEPLCPHQSIEANF